eukprot:COSAG02_NODE_446_length_22141_cov_17.963842_17_plen_97_part_00
MLTPRNRNHTAPQSRVYVPRMSAPVITSFVPPVAPGLRRGLGERVVRVAGMATCGGAASKYSSLHVLELTTLSLLHSQDHVCTRPHKCLQAASGLH